MNVFLEQPAWLWLLVLVLAMGLATAWMGGLGGMRRGVAIASRAALVAILVLLLAGLSTRRETNRLAVVAVVDASGSVERFYRGAASAPASAIDDGSAGPVPGQPPGAASGGASGGASTDPPGAPPATTPSSRPLDAASAVRAFLDGSTRQRGAEDLLGVVAFDGGALALSVPSRDRAWEREIAGPGVEGTNIEAALELAAALIPPDAAGRIVLFSDGNETSGDAVRGAGAVSALATRRARGGLPVDVAPLAYRLTQEVLVESVDAPPTAQAQSTVNVRVVLRATASSSGQLLLLREGQPVDLNGAAEGAGRRVSLAPGRNVELVEVQLAPGRVHRFRAVYEPDATDVLRVDGGQVMSGDTTPENNQGDTFTISPGKGAVLLVEGAGLDATGGGTLAATLRSAGIEVSTVAPEAMPRDVLGLQAYDMVILENVPAEALAVSTQEQLVAFVRDLGGGLVMVGGPDSFGAGGWKGSPVASILPVDVEVPDRVVSPQAATLFVIDNSGSMRRSVLGSLRNQQEIANEATALAIGSLDRSDLVGVIVFNSEAEVVVPLSRNEDPKRSIELVRDIGPGGGTDLAEGLELAIEQMRDAEAKVKHVVVLSDGKSQREDELPGLASRLKAMGVKVSTIVVGDDADPASMRALASIGGGTYYEADDPNTLPRIFLKAVRVVRSPLVREGAFSPVVLASGSGLASGLGASPPLGGLVITRPRPPSVATLAMAAPTGEPVLAHWGVGLGQVVAFTSDASRWATQWHAWDGYERMWTQIVRGAARPAGGRVGRASAIARDGRLVLAYDASGDDGSPIDGLDVPATVYLADGASREVRLTQTGPGRYEGAAALPGTGSAIAIIKPRVREGATLAGFAPVIVGATAQEGTEFRALASDDARLAEIARAGGGRVLEVADPESARLFDRTGIEPARAIEALWKPLMIAALIAAILDVANRRVAWDRLLPKRREMAALASAAPGVARVSGLRERLERGGPEPSLALDERDAKELARAARDRRRAAAVSTIGARAHRTGGDASREPRVAGSSVEGRDAAAGDSRVDSGGVPRTPQTAPPVAPQVAPPVAPQDPPRDDAGGLLAAKRRAARRFED